MRAIWILLLALVVAPFVAPTSLQAQTAEIETVEAATETLDEIMRIPAQGIPRSLLKNAYGIAIIPDMLKAGFVVGIRHGNGVVIRKDKNGVWQAPFFVKMTGASVGFQAGVQATDVILVFKSQKSVAGLMRGKFTIGADASVAAGPIGRQAAAATDAHLKAEILSYSRSRGLFAGVALDGAVVRVDQRATNAYYRPQPGRPAGQLPPSAAKFLQRVILYTGEQQITANATVIAAPQPGAVIRVDEAQLLQQQLAKSSRELHAVVDKQWQQYLALPSAVYTGHLTANATPELQASLARYSAVARDQRYGALTGRPEFQTTYSLLGQIVALQQRRQTSVLN